MLGFTIQIHIHKLIAAMKSEVSNNKYWIHNILFISTKLS